MTVFGLKDFMSGIIGLIIFLLGAIPILEDLNVVNLGVSNFLNNINWFIGALPYILAIAGFYLLIEAIIEISNSNAAGTISFIVGALIMVLGILPILYHFGIGPAWFSMGFLANPWIYRIIFMIEGIFLMLATFAMEY